MRGRFRDKKNKYEFALGGKMSQIFTPSVSKPELGYAADWSFQKVSGSLTWGGDQTLQTDKWNPNDLGYNGGNNFVNSHIGIQYSQYQPNKVFLQSNWWFNINHNMRYAPNSFMDYGLNWGFWGKFKNQSLVSLFS